ncbi:MAG: glycosyltransferase [Candidatus Altiarchaeota archaeon]|nr:glycosyltransferase [Candidatus Altiarchaeota archaeon]
MIELILSLFFIAMILLYTSWLILVIMPRKEIHGENTYPHLSVILPAHNESHIIRETLNALFRAKYPGSREIIVVNDGSTDGTLEILKELAGENKSLQYINTNHLGKANAMNEGFKNAKGEIIVSLDADSKVDSKALVEIVKPFADERVGAVSGIIRGMVNRNILTWFQDFEYVLSSGWRYALNRANSTYIFPGFAAYRREALKAVGGFKEDTLAEDFDIGVRLKKKGYKLLMSNAVIYTKMPETLKGLMRQRMRWGRGTIQVIKKHSDVPFNKSYGATGVYGIPSQMYWFLHSFVVIPLTFYQVFEGYLRWFVNHNDYLSMNVAKYIFNWFSVYGMIDYTEKALTGQYEFTHLFMLSLVVFLLGLLYNIAVILRVSRMRLRYLFVVFFFFPYSVFALAAYSFPSIIELFPNRRESNVRVNVWEKNR